MNKNCILIAAAEKNDRVKRLEGILLSEYRIEYAASAEEAIALSEEKEGEIVALIIDGVSAFPRAQSLLSHVKEANSYLDATPVLLLTDDTLSQGDEQFLGETAIGMIRDGESERVILQRVAMAIDAINSVSFAEFSEMLKVLPSLIYLKDAKGRYVFCSQYLHHLDHYDEPGWTIRGKTDMEIRKDRENARKAYASDMQIVATGKGTSYIIEENDDGVQEYLQLIKEPLKDGHGKVRGIIAIINNVTEQEMLRKELQKKSITDELTGLYNRGHFDEVVAHIDSKDYPLTVISADCDGLKTVNDLYGHMVGDEYLRLAVTLFKTTLPENCQKFRTGGDEFVFLLKRTGEKEAREYLEKLCADQKTFRIKDRVLSVSFGAATAEGPEEPIKACIAQSDAEMYRNKKEKKKKK